MGKILAIVGNIGVGKTTLAHQLCAWMPFVPALEEQQARPFQERFQRDRVQYALANQVDFLLFRAEQEFAIRQGSAPGIVDGGLDEDFYVFTRLFHHKGYLPNDQFQLCQRLYTALRQALSPPDLIIRLVASPDVLAQRFARRGRILEIATLRDIEIIEALLDDWLGGTLASPLITIDVSLDDPTFAWQRGKLLALIREYIAG